MPQTDQLRREAEIFGRYLLGKNPDAESISLYIAAASKAPAPSPRDEKILRFVLKNRWAVGLADSALAFGHPASALRLRMLTMTAILESRPAYADRYLPKKHSPLFFFAAGWFAFRAVIKMMAGKFILLFV